MQWDLIVAFGCGMLCMWALSNPRKAANTLRSFLGRASRGAKDLNEQYSGDRSDRREPPRDRERPRDDRYDGRDRGRDRHDDRYVYPRRPFIPHRREVTCERCKGSGKIKATMMDFSGQATKRCPDCDGYGTIEVER
jgi:hypothetical protein